MSAIEGPGVFEDRSSSPSRHKLRPTDIHSVVCNRVTASGQEQYLVRWAGNWGSSRIPYSWHTIDELSNSLCHLQSYLENRQNESGSLSLHHESRSSSRKRRTPDDEPISQYLAPAQQRSVHPDYSRSSSVMSASSDSSRSLQSESRGAIEPGVYNAVLQKKEGYIIAKASPATNVAHVSGLPTSTMLEHAAQASTTAAENRIRSEMTRKLKALPGAPITFVNTLDRTSPPLSFQFVTKSVLREGVEMLDVETIVGCKKCRPDMGAQKGCEYTKMCGCLEFAAVDEARLTEEERAIYEASGKDNVSKFGKKFPYFSSGTRKGCLVPFYLESRNAIYECNQNCRCGPGCKNRNVQYGRKVELQIFKTQNRGWGLRCSQDLREGDFIDTYRGEIVTDAEANIREREAGLGKPSYLYVLDKFGVDNGIAQEDLYVIDGEYLGGPTRFINHSCEPNCRQYTVSYNKYDFRVYEIALFAYRDIPAYEELLFDYMDKDDDDPLTEPEGEHRAECNCGANNCRKWLWV
ncbi:hypothetical protein B0A49_07517 [Cryomyces minteri]|uniref:Histone-lysine N-methyltransferase, H3 lysine-9 specific n=1 Tax=Cryomyces minteri TaxID=331657 RepID=A0A4U0WZ60_9PEZI|nr:hypothetical protein B0A49_07517 [Cryomyces minteri]